MTEEERFWSKVNKTELCWLWTGGQLYTGQGQFSTSQRTVLSHRYSYELINGPNENANPHGGGCYA